MAFMLSVINLSGQEKILDSIRNARIKAMDSLANFLKTAKDDSNKVKALNEYAIRIPHKSSQGFDSTLNYLNEAIMLAQKIKYPKGEAKSYFFLGDVYGIKGNESEKLRFYTKAYNLSQQINDRGNMALYHENMGNHFQYNKEDGPQALSHFYESLKLRKEINDKEGMAVIYGDLALCFFYQKKYFEAIQNSQQAIKLYEEIDDNFSRGQEYNNLGNWYMQVGLYSEAIKCYGETAKSLNEDVSSLIADAYNFQGNYTEALKIYEANLERYKNNNNKKLMAWCLDKIGTTYINQAENLEKNHKDQKLVSGSLKAAQENLNKAQDIYIALKIPNDGRIDRINYLLGKIYKLQAKELKKQNGQPEVVNFKLNEAMTKFSALYPSWKNEAALYVNMGDVLAMQAAQLNSYDANKKYKEAIDTLKKAIVISKESSITNLRDAYNVMAEIYLAINDFKNAYEYKDLYMSANDSIINVESVKKLEQVRAQLMVDKALAEEQVRQDKVKSDMQYAFLRHDDSVKFQQSLINEQLKQQTLLAKQREQDLILKQISLDLSNKQTELNKLAYVKSQAELQVEQSKGVEKEKQLTIAEQEKSLQQSQLQLKENQLQTQKKQRLFYLGGIALLLLLFVVIYRNIKTGHKAERIIAAERLKSEKARAAHKMAELELQSLRAQLNPHFMFNSLNAIQELILREDNENSHLYLSRFSELLRMLLDNANQPFVSLRKEISLLELYLSLENLRIPDLNYSIEIDPSIDNNKTAIPNMMLQPYIENAIWHGLSHKKGERKLVIRISKKENNIVCQVEDNGVGRKMSAELKSLYRKEHRSKGMELLSKRFNLLSKEYGSDIQAKVEDLDDNGTALGTRVAITIPYSLTEQLKPIYI
jgi:tetratricopeptide (TPR) repeat protein